MSQPNSICLNFPQYSDWYDVIRIDNLEAMKSRLDSVEDKTVVKLINGCFKIENTILKTGKFPAKWLKILGI